MSRSMWQIVEYERPSKRKLFHPVAPQGAQDRHPLTDLTLGNPLAHFSPDSPKHFYHPSCGTDTPSIKKQESRRAQPLKITAHGRFCQYSLSTPRLGHLRSLPLGARPSNLAPVRWINFRQHPCGPAHGSNACRRREDDRPVGRRPYNSKTTLRSFQAVLCGCWARSEHPNSRRLPPQLRSRGR